MPSNLPKIVARADNITVDKFKVVAKKHERSVSQETVYLIKKAITEYENKYGTIVLKETE